VQRAAGQLGEPSIGFMAFARLACWACVAALALLAGGSAVAQAGTRNDEILVLDHHGRVHAHTATGAGATATATATTTESRPPRRSRTHASRKRKPAPKRTVLRELGRLRDGGALTPEDYADRRAVYEDAKRQAKPLKGTRRIELRAVLATLDSVAARGKLTASRVAPLWLTLERNVEWWITGPIPGAGQRIGFEGSELVWQYYPSQGMQIQWLGTFGKLNALAKGSKRTNARTSLLTDEILGLASERAGGLAWEYLFAFGGGSAPWVSSLSQGTGLQALARSAVKLGRQADVLPVTQRALAIFRKRAPEGVRVPAKEGWAGPHYLQYSFAPALYILNGFVQSVVGLHDYAEITGDPTALALYEEGEREAAREVPEYDTGAWSLYSTGTSEHESDVGYHELLRDFLVSMCERAQAPVYCDTAARFTTYETQPPVLALAQQRLRGGRDGTLRVRLSKMSAVDVRILRGGRIVATRSLGTMPYGLVRVRWSVPRRAGTYDVQVSARDLNGNSAEQVGTVEVLKPIKKARRG
jgi:hypothetical protein